MTTPKKSEIDRRTFVAYSVAAGAATVGRRSLGASPPAPDQSEEFELGEADISELQTRMERGQETAESLTTKYLARIEATNLRGPELRAVIEINPEAPSIAKALDQERKAGKVRGALHGIPVLLKDNIATADRMHTTAGSTALVDARCPRDAFLVERLRAAGAVVLGKTNLSEWANFRSTHATSGWSGRGGQTRNPYALDRNPSGSSSGSAVAVAANLCAAAVGSETDGSIVSPSNNCGLVGIKPTLGLVSRSGIVPIAHSQDTAGPMARSVAAAATLLTAMTGADSDDPATAASSGKGSDYAKALDPGGLKGVRIGVPRKFFFGQNGPADRVTDAAIADLKRLGAEIIDPADFDSLEFEKSELEVLLTEFRAGLNTYLSKLEHSPVRNLKELIAFNEAHAVTEMPYFAQELFEMAEAKGPLTDRSYRDALARNLRLSRKDGIDKVMDRHKLDALVAPTAGPAILIDLVNGDSGPNGASTLPAVAGYPHVTVPGGEAFGLPVGISFFGRAWSEAKLIRIAYAYEQATRHRKPPRFLPTVDLTVRA
jgi:amidase